MLSLTPENAADLIRAGGVTEPISVAGQLDLRGFSGERLTDGLQCYELDARGSNLTCLPESFRVEARLVLDDCRKLSSLPEGLETGSISLRNCVSLKHLPDRISTWFLDLTGCTQFESWPAEGTIHRGSLILRNCVRVRSLPGWLGRLSHLDLAGCVGLTEIPEGVSVSSWIDIGGSSVTRLPASMAGSSLRWRGVRINEQIAFRPEELTAKQALEERNAESRRVIIERMGYLRFIEEAGAKVLDQDFDPGENASF